MTSKRAHVIAVNPAGPCHQVLTVQGNGTYRRTVCEECPWRLDQTGKFPSEAFRHSANAAHDQATQAHEVSLKGITWERRRGKRDNVSLHNLIYYNCLLVRETQGGERTKWVKSLQKHVEYWEANFERLGQDHLRELHSLMLAYESLSNLERAVLLAKRILALFARNSGGVLLLPGTISEQLMERTIDEDEKEVVKDCWRILRVRADPQFLARRPARGSLTKATDSRSG